MIPMNDSLAEQTIIDHKYLLESVENRCAIAFYAVSNRNHSLYQALQRFYRYYKIQNQDESLTLGGPEAPFATETFLKQVFNKIMESYDFMSIVMYPSLKHRRSFIHDCWLIAKSVENDELKMAISQDEYFYLDHRDLFELLKSKDSLMMKQLLKSECKLLVMEDTQYRLVEIKKA